MKIPLRNGWKYHYVIGENYHCSVGENTRIRISEFFFKNKTGPTNEIIFENIYGSFR